MIYDIAVIGGGSAGTMATLRSVLNNDSTILFSGSKQNKIRSRAQWVTKVENMPGHLQYKRGIEEPNKESLEWLETGNLKDKFTWKKNLGIIKLEKVKDIFHLTDSEGNKHQAHHVILCTGVMDVQPMINGKMDAIFPFANIALIDYCIRCDGHHSLNLHTGIIGHTESALWVAVMVKERYNNPSMSLFLNGEKLQIQDQILNKLIKLYDIQIYEPKIIEVVGNPQEKTLTGFKLDNNQTMRCNLAFVSLGMIVYNELAKNLGAELDPRGFVITNTKGESSIPGLFVAGDLRANAKKQIYTAWDMAVDSADEINMRIRRTRREQLLQSQN